MTLFTAIKKWLRRMFGKTEEKTVQPVKTKKKLSRADKKQIEAAIARANRTDKKKEQKNGAASSFPQCSIPYHGAAGTAAIAASDCRVGVSPGRDRARAACPRGVSGRDQHHAERSGGDLSGHQGN